MEYLIDRDYLELVRILLEVGGAILMILGGKKYDIALRMIYALVHAIESTDDKATKSMSTMTTSATGTKNQLDQLLQNFGFLGRNKNGEGTSEKGTSLPGNSGSTP